MFITSIFFTISLLVRVSIYCPLVSVLFTDNCFSLTLSAVINLMFCSDYDDFYHRTHFVSHRRNSKESIACPSLRNQRHRDWHFFYWREESKSCRNAWDSVLCFLEKQIRGNPMPIFSLCSMTAIFTFMTKTVHFLVFVLSSPSSLSFIVSQLHCVMIVIMILQAFFQTKENLVDETLSLLTISLLMTTLWETSNCSLTEFPFYRMQKGKEFTLRDKLRRAEHVEWKREGRRWRRSSHVI